MQNGAREMESIKKYDIAYRNLAYHKSSMGEQLAKVVCVFIRFNTVLDVGCGPGYGLMQFMLEKKIARGIESCEYLFEAYLRAFERAGVVKRAKAQSIPHLNDSFDLVYCTEVLEHIPESDVHTVIGELVRVSKKYIFVTISTAPSVFYPELNLHETVRPKEWWDRQWSMYRLRPVKHNIRGGDNGEVYLFKKY